MNLDLTNALWIEPGHPLHGTRCHLAIRGGRVTAILSMDDANLEAGDEQWDLNGACVSNGWWDVQAELRDPGFETAETISTGLDAAAQGGFTRIAPSPHTSPVVDGKASIEFLRKRAESHVVGVLPLGCVSAGAKGKALAELYDMREAGAVGFSDDGPLDHPELLRRALEYVAPKGGVIYAAPIEGRFQSAGVVHEGAVSTELGLSGIPIEQETLRLQRDLTIAEYTGGRLHIPVVSSAAGLALIRAAKEAGVLVSCGTAAHHLCFDHQAITGFDSRFKTQPPLREETDRKALLAAVIDGTIDVICSDHRPRNPEEHETDFSLVRPGIAGLHATANALIGQLNASGLSGIAVAEVLHRVLVEGPRKLLTEATSDDRVELTIFDPSGKSTLPRSASKAANTLYNDLDQEYPGLLGGRILGVITPGGIHRNPD
jgi:dihydroorotase